MSGIWGRVVGVLNLKPDLGRVGSPRPRQVFAGRVDGAHVEVTFDTRSGDVRIAVSRREDQVLSGEDDWRLLPRGRLHGWAGGPFTGDADFDAMVAIMATDPDEIRLRLDSGTRALAAELIESGAWVSGEMVLLEGSLVTDVRSLDEARTLIATAGDLVRGLGRVRTVALIDMAFSDPSPSQRALARSRLGRIDTDPARVIAAIAHHRPEDGPALLGEFVEEASSEGWWTALAAFPPKDVIDTMAAGYRHAGPLKPLAQDRMAAAVALCVEQDRPGWLAPIGRALGHDVVLGKALLERFAGHPGAVAWLAGQPIADEALRIQLIHTASEDADAAMRTLIAFRPATSGGEVELVKVLAESGRADAAKRLLDWIPGSSAGRDAVVRAVCGMTGRDADHALLRWALRASSPSSQAVAELADRLAEALDARPDHPLASACDTDLPSVMSRAIVAAISKRRPRFGARLLIRHAPDMRSSAPKDEARLLELLGELGDPAGEPRCLAALIGSDYLRVAAAGALRHIGTVRAIEPLEEISGFFASSDVKTLARDAIKAIRERETAGPRGGLSVSAGASGQVSLTED